MYFFFSHLESRGQTLHKHKPSFSRTLPWESDELWFSCYLSRPRLIWPKNSVFLFLLLLSFCEIVIHFRDLFRWLFAERPLCSSSSSFPLPFLNLLYYCKTINFYLTSFPYTFLQHLQCFVSCFSKLDIFFRCLNFASAKMIMLHS